MKKLIMFVAAILVFAGLSISAYAIPSDCDKGIHDYEVTVFSATDDADGEEKYECKYCAFTFTRLLPAIGHSWTQWAVYEKATCTESGILYRICTSHPNYPHRQEETIPATGHKYRETITDPTCGEKGTKTYRCDYCGLSYTEPFGEIIEHIYIEEIIIAPDCEIDGERAFVCSSCGDTYTEPVPATGHNYGEWITDKQPSETEKGHRFKTCTNNSNHIIEEEIACTVPEIAKDNPEDSAYFPNMYDVLFFLVVLVLTIGFCITIHRDIYILRWTDKKSMPFGEWMKRNG